MTGRTPAAPFIPELYGMITEASVISQLKTIYDPEIPVDIYELGLIYAFAIRESDIHITMTLTTATCPAAAYLPQQVIDTLREIEGVREVQVQVVYEPKWNRSMMREEARAILGYR